MEDRGTFKFFRSFYEAACQIEDKEVRCEFYDSICAYGLYGEEPDTSGFAKALFMLVKPNLDASAKKAAAGAVGGSKSKANSKQVEANRKQTASKTEANGSKTQKPASEVGSRKKEEGSKEVGSIPPKAPQGDDFEVFWNAYPKKVGKQAAKKAFEKVNVPVESLVSAIKRQECSPQWSKDGGQYIPNPATWLNQGRWEDELTAVLAQEPVGFIYGPEELAAMRKLQQIRRSGHI